jgi:hypothetical protein
MQINLWNILPKHGTFLLVTLYIKQVAKGKVLNLRIQILAICKINNNLFLITNTCIHRRLSLFRSNVKYQKINKWHCAFIK